MSTVELSADCHHSPYWPVPLHSPLMERGSYVTNSGISGRDSIRALFSHQSPFLCTCTFSNRNVAIDFASIHANFWNIFIYTLIKQDATLETSNPPLNDYF